MPKKYCVESLEDWREATKFAWEEVIKQGEKWIWEYVNVGHVVAKGKCDEELLMLPDIIELGLKLNKLLPLECFADKDGHFDTEIRDEEIVRDLTYRLSGFLSHSRIFDVEAEQILDNSKKIEQVINEKKNPLEDECCELSLKVGIIGRRRMGKSSIANRFAKKLACKTHDINWHLSDITQLVQADLEKGIMLYDVGGDYWSNKEQESNYIEKCKTDYDVLILVTDGITDFEKKLCKNFFDVGKEFVIVLNKSDFLKEENISDSDTQEYIKKIKNTINNELKLQKESKVFLTYCMNSSVLRLKNSLNQQEFYEHFLTQNYEANPDEIKDLNKYLNYLVEKEHISLVKKRIVYNIYTNAINQKSFGLSLYRAFEHSLITMLDALPNRYSLQDINVALISEKLKKIVEIQTLAAHEQIFNQDYDTVIYKNIKKCIEMQVMRYITESFQTFCTVGIPVDSQEWGELGILMSMYSHLYKDDLDVIKVNLQEKYEIMFEERKYNILQQLSNISDLDIVKGINNYNLILKSGLRYKLLGLIGIAKSKKKVLMDIKNISMIVRGIKDSIMEVVSHSITLENTLYIGRLSDKLICLINEIWTNIPNVRKVHMKLYTLHKEVKELERSVKGFLKREVGVKHNFAWMERLLTDSRSKQFLMISYQKSYTIDKIRREKLEIDILNLFKKVDEDKLAYGFKEAIKKVTKNIPKVVSDTVQKSVQREKERNLEMKNRMLQHEYFTKTAETRIKKKLVEVLFDKCVARVGILLDYKFGILPVSVSTLRGKDSCKENVTDSERREGCEIEPCTNITVIDESLPRLKLEDKSKEAFSKMDKKNNSCFGELKAVLKMFKDIIKFIFKLIFVSDIKTEIELVPKEIECMQAEYDSCNALVGHTDEKRNPYEHANSHRESKFEGLNIKTQGIEIQVGKNKKSVKER